MGADLIRFSANLGFLWTELALPDAIRAAARAGFDAVECHYPYQFDPADVNAALIETGLSMVSLNTIPGDRPGDLGVAAVAGRENEARECIDRAIDYSLAIGGPMVSVLAGRTDGGDSAERTYRANLEYAASRAAAHGLTVLIEPLSTGLAEGYHLVSLNRAVETIEALAMGNLMLMTDCFHTRYMHGDLRDALAPVLRHIGHVQIASFPDRSEPIDGDIEYSTLLPWLVEQGYNGPFGAEYTARDGLDAGLTWLRPWHEQRTDETKEQQQ